MGHVPLSNLNSFQANLSANSDYNPMQSQIHSKLIMHQPYFTLGIFEHYRMQLVTFAENLKNRYAITIKKTTQVDNSNVTKENRTPFEKIIKRILKGPSLEVTTPQEKYEEELYYHQKILSAIRLLLIDEKQKLLEKESDASNQELKLEICEWMYLKPDLLPQIIHIFKTHFFAKIENTELKLADLMESTFEYIQKKKYTGYKNESERYFEGHRSGQLRYPLFNMKSGTSVYYCANLIAEYFRGKNNSEICVVPEYENMIKNSQKNFLNIVLMCREDAQGFQEEFAAARALENLDQKYNNSFIINLDMLSYFYHQLGEFSNPFETFKNFKRQFLEQMFSSAAFPQPFYWSNKLDINAWKERCAQIISEIHDVHFAQYKKLTVEERKILIDLVYIKIIEEFCKINEINVCTVTCRYLADRTASILSLLYVEQTLSNEHPELTQEEKEKAVVIQMAPAFLGYNRAVCQKRFERNLLTCEHLENAYQKLN